MVKVILLTLASVLFFLAITGAAKAETSIQYIKLPDGSTKVVVVNKTCYEGTKIVKCK